MPNDLPASAAPRLHIVLHQPEIPPNTGNIGRTCVAIGAKLWLVRPLGFQLDEKQLRRAGLDYWPHLQWEAVDDWSSLQTRLPLHTAWYFSKTATTIYTRVRYRLGDVLVFGSETQGLPTSLLAEHAERALRIPINPVVRSLNLANSVAIAVYEAVRQFDEIGAAETATQ
jgi:tRNA (cytidine/uridine-2'-O-)-methyltransferase